MSRQRVKRTASFADPPLPQINPFAQPEYFHNTINLSFIEAVKLVVGSFTLVPLRLIFLLPLLFLLWVSIKIILLGYDPVQRLPFEEERKKKVPLLSYVVRAILFVWGFYHISEEGKPASPKDAPIIVANHISWFDPLVIAAIIAPSFVSRKENESIPIVGDGILAAQAILVDRNSPTSRKDVTNRISEYANSGGRYPQLAIFPEGTCTNNKSLISFKPGAFIAGKPVQPLAITYPHVYYDCCWVSEVDGGFQGWRSLCQIVQHVHLKWMPVYTPSAAEKADPNLFASNVRSQMARALNIPVTEHSFEDVKLGLQAIDLHLPPEDVAQVEVKAIKQFWKMSEEDLTELLKKFSSMGSQGDGTVNQQEFGKALGLPADSPYVQRVFFLMDKNDNGKIDFREYLSGIAFVSREIGTTETIKFSFSLFDVNKDGKIDENELYSMITTPFPEMTKEEVARLFKKADVDGDGYISLDDFTKFLTKNPEYHSMLSYYLEEQKAQSPVVTRSSQ